MNPLSSWFHRTVLGRAPLKLLVPAYFRPGERWDQMRAGAPTVGLLILNPDSGPGLRVDPGYAAAATAARAAGLAVLGYVHTSYGGRPREEVLAEIARYYDDYAVSGIFLDEVPAADTARRYYGHYTLLAEKLRARDATARLVLNPGMDTCPDYLDFADVLVTFEQAADQHPQWVRPEWTLKWPPERFCHLIHSAPAAALPACLQRARAWGVGWVYVTDDRLPNPWDVLPTYWPELLARAGV